MKFSESAAHLLRSARDSILCAFAKEDRVAWLWSMLIFVCIIALLPALPLVACLLLIQWLFSSAFRRVIAATMMSLLAAYVGIMYLTVQDLWTVPWYEVAAMLLAIVIGYLGRLRHERAVCGLVEKNAVLGRLLGQAESSGDAMRNAHSTGQYTDAGFRNTPQRPSSA